jgi:DNA-binding NtrC family response regulator
MDKILIIDDDESMRDTLKLFLADSDYELLLAENGEVGIKMLDKFHPDLVITDLIMLKISGFDVLKESKKIDKNVNVIVLSAFDDMSRTIMAMQLGAYDYLTKPIKQEHLNLIISRALESKKLNERILSAITEQTKEYKKVFYQRDKEKIILRAYAHQHLKKEIFSRAKGICEICLINPAKQLHHKKYTKDIKDIIAICLKCHQEIRETI